MPASILEVAGPPMGQSPVDIIEAVLKEREYPYDRPDSNELCASIKGQWADYNLTVTWMPEICLLHVACAFDLKVPKHRVSELDKLILGISGGLWFGHFDRWEKDGAIVFRCSAPFPDSLPTATQGACFIDASIKACEMYYQTFQQVVWAGKPAEHCLLLAQFDGAEGQA